MKNYIFLTNKFDQGDSIYYAIPASKIETLLVVDTYARYGQPVSVEDTGDYHINNQYSDAKKDCEKAILEKFNKEVFIDRYNDCVEVIENNEVDEWICQNDENARDFINEINTFITKWCEKNNILQSCEGFNYWDGSNWATIITSYENDGNNSHEIIKDKKLIDKLNNGIENMEFLKEGFGNKTYVFEDVKIIDSCYQGTWASYELTIK